MDIDLDSESNFLKEVSLIEINIDLLLEILFFWIVGIFIEDF